ncbi:glycosyl transferase [Halorubrum kocurii JCM 14978]|uniref:Glycosyl transferase n=1 Tax=Halorubrum kocurii JCM 14978 TaxID=1230456 RepID=M0NM54_9EURY|nr:glycosyl transferase [Halorubrum kocurii JCM 14978]
MRSVADQTYAPIELIVVDDCSPEPIEATVNEVDTAGLRRTEVIRHKQNMGANAARNTGIEAATGEVIAFLDDDDRWGPSVVRRYVDAFESGGPSVGVVTVGVRTVNENGTKIGEFRPTIESDALDALLSGTRVGSFSRFAVRSDVIDSAGTPDERLPCWQDWEWQFRLAFHCDFGAIPEPIVVRTRGTHDQITDTFEERREIAYPFLLDRHRERIRAARGPRAERRFVATLSQSLAFAALDTGRYLTGVRLLLRTLRYDPFSSKAYLYLVVACGGPVTFGTARWVKRRLNALQ